MATSTCIKCDNHSFEVKLAEPKKGAFKMYFVQCTSCGGVVGVTEFYSIGAMLLKLGKFLGINLA
jgi:predicted nucleic-acid-binding Zn-ribbon protein